MIDLAGQSKKIVLIVDDNEQVRRICCVILEKAGYAVIHASNGPEALGTSRQYAGNIDALLTDVDLPAMSGIVLARKLVAERPEIGVLLESGNPDYGVQTEFPFLAKPFYPDALRSAIASVLASCPDETVKHGPDGRVRTEKAPARDRSSPPESKRLEKLRRKYEKVHTY